MGSSTGVRPATSAWPHARAHAPGEPRPVERTVREAGEVERRDREERSWSDTLADRITAFCGSMPFFFINAVWFALWITINLGRLGLPPFDPFPFGLLTMIVSLEAIFLAIFVLISQNRQAALSDERAKVDLQMDILAEEEVTTLINLVLEIHDRLGLSHPDDPEIEELREPTDVRAVLDEIDRRDGSGFRDGPADAHATTAR